jgi:two-component system cell cycle sensor histidine kinase/response regulator CckA
LAIKRDEGRSFRPLSVLVVEDSETDAELLLLELRQGGFDVTFERVETRASMKAALDRGMWDLIVSDYSLPAFDALDALSVLQKSGTDIPLIVVSGTIGEENAVAALQAGAADFIVKGKLARLLPAIERELREAKVRESRRLLEDQLRQAQKLEAIGSLAGGMAHDFNNLLSIILGYTSMISEAVEPDHPIQADLEQVQMAGERGADLTKQLLAFSRRQVLEPRSIDLNAVLTAMRKMLKRLLGEHIELSLVTSKKVGRVHADAGQIEQVILNLVVNARDAMSDGGVITIETRDVELNGYGASAQHAIEAGEYVMLSVKDTGLGMSDAVRERVFEPFFTTKELGKGTGLGLSTVFGIVKQSRGHIAVESEEGKGSTFRIHFPRFAEGTEQPLSRPPPPLTLRGSEVILLVEDDEQVRNVARALLSRYGYQVLDAQNGGEAFLACEKHAGAIDLLITDLIMPRMNGLELGVRLMTMRPGLKVIYMSGYIDPSIDPQRVAENGFPFIQKPLRPDAFLTKIREVLDQPVLQIGKP